MGCFFAGLRSPPIGDEATCKRLSLRNGQVWLLPENPAFDPIDGSEAEIIGIVKAVVREY